VERLVAVFEDRPNHRWSVRSTQRPQRAPRESNLSVGKTINNARESFFHDKFDVEVNQQPYFTSGLTQVREHLRTMDPLDTFDRFDFDATAGSADSAFI
jgi:hypothetical protein